MQTRSSARLLSIMVATLACVAGYAVDASASEPDRQIDFAREIRPLLSDRCFTCHGPDNKTRQADLRLDLHDHAIAELESGTRAVVPGDPETSELYQRITAEDESMRMPPAETGKTLTEEQIELIRKWIEQGAQWEEHWAFTPITPQPLPEVSNGEWVKNPIDRFVLARLEAEGLQPSPPADKRRLIRRVTLDLTGLPPTIEGVDAFLADESPDAYEKVVDRLLASPAHAERMALTWLDAARYADSQGYVFDTERQMWRWRDWVIDAFKENMPYDQFTIEQLAGDLLPNATLSQKIASGFNRNHTINGEFGAIDEEYLVENIADRVNTTATVWLGLTAICARCHDHKFDPISQREYYEFYAFFGNIAEKGVDGIFNNAGPVITAPTPEQSARLKELERQLAEAEKKTKELEPTIQVAQMYWEKTFAEPIEDVKDGLIGYWPFDKSANDESGNGFHADMPGQEAYGGGIFGGAAFFFGLNLLKSEGGKLHADEPFTLSAWVMPNVVKGRHGILARTPEGITLQPGYSFHIHDGALTLVLANEYPSKLINVETDPLIEPGKWHHVAATYDGSGKANGVKLYINGQPRPLRVLDDTLEGDFYVDEPLAFGEGAPNAAFRGLLDEARIYGRQLSPEEIQRLLGVSIHSLLAIKPEERSGEVSRRVREYFIKHVAPAEWRAAHEHLVAVREATNSLRSSLPTVMVMQELDKNPRVTRILEGGAYDRPGEEVQPGTPRFLPPMAEDLPRNRLGLAKWIVDPANPLTARVAVNRFWQMYFGVGLVRTAEDFGYQGEPPSHPELLDWLASEFIRCGWDMRAMQRLIVTSATYQQSSRVTNELLKRDPENRLLARGPRSRLEAEFIRDQALALSGLLVHKLGGPSVKPYMPEGLWSEAAFDPTGNRWSGQYYEQDHGENLYRRSMYIFWKRTAPPPAMLAFDAPERERCVVRRSTTNTPLQALVTMNDPTFVEAARKMAERVMKEGGYEPRQRISHAFRMATARELTETELDALVGLYQEQLERFRADPAAAEGLLSVGESPCDESLDKAELAAYAAVANVILNLDETLTKS